MLGLLMKRERLAQNMSQQALCEGICTPSYLSKIENGSAQCSDEMYALLFGALKIVYITDAALLNTFSSLLDAYWQSWQAGEIAGKETVEAMAALCPRLRHSPHGIDAAILECLLHDRQISREEVMSLSSLRPAFNKRQMVMFTLVESYYCRAQKRYTESIACLERIKSAEYPTVYFEMAHDCFAMGAYRQCAENGEEAYRLYALCGHVKSMLTVSMLVAAAYSNAKEYDRMRRWFAVCENINSVLGRDDMRVLLYYNEGASCLMFRECQRGLRCLQEGEALARQVYRNDADAMDLYAQKLAFAYIFTGDPDNARRTLETIRHPSGQQSIEASVALMHYMLNTKGYQGQKRYCELLENCLLEAEQEARGRLEFFGQFLLEAYKATRQYKKAVQIMEKYKLSHLLK